MSLIRLYRLIEAMGPTARFFLLRNIWHHGQPIVRQKLIHASMDRRFLVRSLGMDAKEMHIDEINKQPQGPGIRIIGAWTVDGRDSSVAIMEIEMDAAATGIRTGVTSDYQDPFTPGQDYGVDQISSPMASKKGAIISYPVGPGMSPPFDLKPYKHGVNVDLEKIT